MKKGRMAPGSCSEPCGHVMPCNPNFATDRRIMEIIVDAFLDALIDGVKMLPFCIWHIC